MKNVKIVIHKDTTETRLITNRSSYFLWYFKVYNKI